MKSRIFPLLLLLYLFLPATPARGQSIRAVVADQASKQGISDVFVFLSNSSIGTATDEQGIFELELKETREIVLVFSHVSYELLTIEIADATYLRDTFFLQANEVELSEAVVVEKSRKRLRERRLRDFTRAFLGEDINDKLIRISNPEILLFEQEKDRLIARAEEPLLIENRELGYQLSFYLEAFHLYDNDDLFYKGNTFFEPLTGTPQELAQYTDKRREAYSKSSRRFFSDLAGGQLDTTVYQIGFSYLDENRNFVNFQPLNTSDLVPEPDASGGNYVMLIQGFLTVINQDILVKAAASAPTGNDLNSGVKLYNEQQLVHATSYLRSRTNRIIVNRYGKIMNPSEIEEYGYWAGLRVGALLPSDYSPE